jgi:hypothetical protein
VREGRSKYLEAAIDNRNKALTGEQLTEFEQQQEEGNLSEDNVDIDEDDL